MPTGWFELELQVVGIPAPICVRLVVKSITSDDRTAGEGSGRERVQLTSCTKIFSNQVNGILGLAVGEGGQADVAVLVSPANHLPTTTGSPSLHMPRGLVAEARHFLGPVRARHANEDYIAFPAELLLDVILAARMGFSLESLSPQERKAIERVVRRNVRDPLFRGRILKSQGEECLLCGLGLGLVEAAHIVPHSERHDDSEDNGIPLCPNHHSAYDRGDLLSIDGDGVVFVNSMAIEGAEVSEYEHVLGGLNEQISVLSERQAENLREMYNRRQGEEVEWLPLSDVEIS